MPWSGPTHCESAPTAISGSTTPDLWMPAVQLNRMAPFRNGVSKVQFPVNVRAEDRRQTASERPSVTLSNASCGHQLAR
jgi:hypothetical protein